MLTEIARPLSVTANGPDLPPQGRKSMPRGDYLKFRNDARLTPQGRLVMVLLAVRADALHRDIAGVEVCEAGFGEGGSCAFA